MLALVVVCLVGWGNDLVLDERRSTEAVSLVVEPEAVWGVTPDGDSEYPRSDDFETYEDYVAYMDYKYFNDDPEATPPVIHFKDPTAGTVVGRNLGPGPGPDANSSMVG